MFGFPPRVTAYTSSVRGVAPRPDEEVPDTRSPARFLLWTVGRQLPQVAIMWLVCVLWLLPGMLAPLFLGRAIDEGVRAQDMGRTLLWCGLLTITILISVTADAIQIGAEVANWLIAMFRMMKLVARKVAQLGHVITRRVPPGEMLSIASGDADTIGATAHTAARVLSALTSFAVVVMLVLSESVRLGLIVLIASPIIVVGAAPILKPVQKAQLAERERSSKLTGMAVDIVAGLRILRGIGGERTFGDNYAKQSQRVREAGVRVGTWWAAVDSSAVLLSGVLLVLLTWAGASEMIAGRLSVGQLVSFFGYAVFLLNPFWLLFEGAQRWIAGLVSADKTIGLLRHRPPWAAANPDPSRRQPQGTPTGSGHDDFLVDTATGFTAAQGQFTIIVSADPDEAAKLADRLGRYLPSTQEAEEDDEEPEGSKAAREHRRKKAERRARIAAADETHAEAPWGVTLAGVDLTDMPLDEVRRRIAVSDASPGVFAGTLREALDPTGTHDRDEAELALYTVSADDVWDSLPDGWQSVIDERGRGLSGGQRQRLVLARMLLSAPEVAVLVEPTSAVDAHTEARIAARLPGYRKGLTTIATTVSPLWLRQADKVALLDEGRIVAEGTHSDLLATNPAYRAVVTRGFDVPSDSPVSDTKAGS
ncbi:MAG: ABC transporter ATP-binding protein/permease [Propionibacteriaceae bacterium]|jgi:ABC-type multidrug transport system fused ATPase/permease subunit|nr:ABC transporter ATP-binding protein/permease [Propionibacteriaceae bacterium]